MRLSESLSLMSYSHMFHRAGLNNGIMLTFRAVFVYAPSQFLGAPTFPSLPHPSHSLPLTLRAGQRYPWTCHPHITRLPEKLRDRGPHPTSRDEMIVRQDHKHFCSSVPASAGFWMLCLLKECCSCATNHYAVRSSGFVIQST